MSEKEESRDERRKRIEEEARKILPLFNGRSHEEIKSIAYEIVSLASNLPLKMD